MPDDALLEMVVDNVAATRSYEGYWPTGVRRGGWIWMTQYFAQFVLHPTTRIKFGALLCALGYAQVLPNEFDWTSIHQTNIPTQDRVKLAQLETLAKLNNNYNTFSSVIS